MSPSLPFWDDKRSPGGHVCGGHSIPAELWVTQQARGNQGKDASMHSLADSTACRIQFSRQHAGYRASRFACRLSTACRLQFSRQHPGYSLADDIRSRVLYRGAWG